MAFPSSFGSQVAAILEVLVNAAVAEISQLAQDGTAVLRLEMCRRDAEVLELRRTLRLMEAELRKAHEAAATTRPAEKQEAPTACETQELQDPAGRPPPCSPEGLSGTGQVDQPGVALVVKAEDELPCPNQDTVGVGVGSGGMGVGSGGVGVGSEVGSSMYLDLGGQDGSLWPQAVFTDAAEPAQMFWCRGGAGGGVPVKEEPEAGPPSPCPAPPPCQPRPPVPLPPGVPPAPRTTSRARRPVNVWRANQRPWGSGARLGQQGEQAAKPFRCLECGKSFTQKTRLKTHQSVHTGERPYRCGVCGKAFSRQDNCQRHERFHSGERPHSCGQCGKSFTVLGNLRIHLEIHRRTR